MAKVTLVTGLVVVYGYMCERFFGWYSGSEYERFHAEEPHYYGPYAVVVLGCLLLCNFLVPQLLGRRDAPDDRSDLHVGDVRCNVGMWLERLRHHRGRASIATSAPSSWEMYYPTTWDFMTLPARSAFRR
jgi:hypothetical protein